MTGYLLAWATRALPLLVLTGLYAFPAAAEYPERPVKLLVPFTAGGPTDALARALAEGMRARLGQPVIVDNRSGAGGNIAAEFVSGAPADGYTLMLGTSGPLAINVSLYKRLAYDPVQSFDPVIMIGSLPNVLVVNPSFPARTAGELVVHGKANKGSLNFGHAGIGGSTHLAGIMFNHIAGTDLVPVAYRGSSQVLTDLIGGQVPISFLDVYTAAPQIHAGTIRALGVTAERRTPLLPDVPTLDEQGIKNIDVSVSFGIVVPKGTPPEIVAKLNSTLSAVLEDPATRALLNKQGIVRAPSISADYLARFMLAEISRWRDVIRSVGIEPQ